MTSEIRRLESRQDRLCERDAFVPCARDLCEIEGDRDIALRYAHEALADPHDRCIADTQRFRWLTNKVYAAQAVGEAEPRACDLAVFPFHGEPKPGSLAVSFSFHCGASHILRRIE